MSMSLARLWRARWFSPGRAAASALVVTGGVVLVFFVIGFFGTARAGASGFGAFSADVLSLINPDQFSRLLFPWRVGSAPWEGLGFVGLGGLVAALFAIVSAARERPARRPGLGFVILAAIGLMMFAWSSEVMIGGRRVLDLHWLYAPFPTLTSGFRASGRFIWPLHYLAILAGIWGVSRLVRARAAGTG